MTHVGYQRADARGSSAALLRTGSTSSCLLAGSRSSPPPLSARACGPCGLRRRRAGAGGTPSPPQQLPPLCRLRSRLTRAKEGDSPLPPRRHLPQIITTRTRRNTTRWTAGGRRTRSVYLPYGATPPVSAPDACLRFALTLAASPPSHRPHHPYRPLAAHAALLPPSGHNHPHFLRSASAPASTYLCTIRADASG